MASGLWHSGQVRGLSFATTPVKGSSLLVFAAHHISRILAKTLKQTTNALTGSLAVVL